MQIVIQVDFRQILAIGAGLVVFGVLYNGFTAWVERKGYMEGFTSLLVAIGVSVTLIPFALLSLPLFLIIVGGFICSGGPMIIGSITRYIRARERAQAEIKRLTYGGQTEGMAK